MIALWNVRMSHISFDVASHPWLLVCAPDRTKRRRPAPARLRGAGARSEPGSYFLVVPSATVVELDRAGVGPREGIEGARIPQLSGVMRVGQEQPLGQRARHLDWACRVRSQHVEVTVLADC